MNGNDRYKEIKVTYMHILILLVAFIGIGMILFFLGFRMGKASVNSTETVTENRSGSKKLISFEKEGTKSDPQSKPAASKKENKQSYPSEINKELQMHNRLSQIDNMNRKTQSGNKRSPIKKEGSVEVSEKKIKPTPISRSTVYAIQIGAFRDQRGAKKEAQKYSRKYPIDIIKIGNLFKVRVGSYPSKKQAQAAMKQNPKFKGCYIVKIKK